MTRRSEQVCPGVVLTRDGELTVNWEAVLDWVCLRDTDGNRRLVWELIYAGLKAGGVEVVQREDRYTVEV